MSITETVDLKQNAYAEAMRYMENARETYAKARKDGRYYQDRKYVRGGANYAYHAVRLAIDAWLALKGIEEPKRKSIEYYRSTVAKLDKKLLARLNAAYDTLHLSGGYDGNLSVDVNLAGLATAEEIIDTIKP